MNKRLAHVVAWTLAALLCSSAVAGEVTVLVGKSFFAPQQDGVWCQEAFPCTRNLNPLSLGIRYDTEKRGSWSLGFGYMDLGHVSSYAIATVIDGSTANQASFNPLDGGYNAQTKSCNGSCGPLARYVGTGDVGGVFGSVSRHWGNFSLEGGWWVYQATWTIRVRQDSSPSTAWFIGTHKDTWRNGPMAGLAYRLDKIWSVRYAALRTDTTGDDYPGVYEGWTHALFLAATFK